MPRTWCILCVWIICAFEIFVHLGCWEHLEHLLRFGIAPRSSVSQKWSVEIFVVCWPVERKLAGHKVAMCMSSCSTHSRTHAPCA